jgi:hypothetical protein
MKEQAKSRKNKMAVIAACPHLERFQTSWK